MAEISFFSVLKNNLKCAICKEKNCAVRYFPKREQYTYSGGSRIVKMCKKDRDAHIKDVLNRKLP